LAASAAGEKLSAKDRSRPGRPISRQGTVAADHTAHCDLPHIDLRLCFTAYRSRVGVNVDHDKAVIIFAAVFALVMSG
jgi:hypothetical protein